MPINEKEVTVTAALQVQTMQIHAQTKHLLSKHPIAEIMPKRQLRQPRSATNPQGQYRNRHLSDDDSFDDAFHKSCNVA